MIGSIGTRRAVRPSALRARNLAERHPLLLAFVGLGLIAGLARISTIQSPLGIDAGQYLYVGHTVAGGGMPYVDAANNKTPLTYLLFAAIDAFPGQSQALVRLTLLPFVAATALAIAAYVAHFANRAAGVLAAVTFAALSGVSAFDGSDPNTEQYGAAPMVGAWWLATRTDTASVLAAGTLTAAAALMNPVLAMAVPFVAFELWRSAPEGSLGRLALAGAGAACPVIAVSVWLVIGGAFDDMLVQVSRQVGGATGGGGG